MIVDLTDANDLAAVPIESRAPDGAKETSRILMPAYGLPSGSVPVTT
jgi:hypothetical protein